MNSTISQSTEEREAEMSGFVIGFAIQVRKWAANTQEGTTPSLKVPCNKHSRSSRSNEKVQATPAVIAVDSPERVLEASFVVGGAAQDASRNACAALEDEVPAGEFPLVDDSLFEASLFKATDVLPPRARRAHFMVDSARGPLIG